MCLYKLRKSGESLLTIPGGDLLFLLAHSAAYVVAGMAIFKYFERVARGRGLLGHY